MKERAQKDLYAAKQNGSQADIDAVQARVDSWSDGGVNKTITHAVSGALIAGMGGGNALDGALGAAAAELARPLTADESKLIQDRVIKIRQSQVVR
jgi:filamentous hemagglutinin